MKNESALDDDWDMIVKQLGGSEELDRSARENGAIQRARKIKDGASLLRLCFAYGPGEKSLRLASAWSQAIELSDISQVALYKRLRKCSPWLKALIEKAIKIDAQPDLPKSLLERPIRLMDGSIVQKCGNEKGAWRIHAVYDLCKQRFSFLELSDEKTGEQFDMAPVVQGEIRIGDRGFMQADRIGNILDAGGDILVRSGWNSGRWLDEEGSKFNLTEYLEKTRLAGEKYIDRSIYVGRKTNKTPLKLRLIAIRKPDEAANEAIDKACKIAKKNGRKPSEETLESARWLILITSLPKSDEYSIEVLSKLYRLRWQIELAFKRLKSILGTKSPPAKDKELAKTFLLSHLLLSVIMEPAVEKLRESFP